MEFHDILNSIIFTGRFKAPLGSRHRTRSHASNPLRFRKELVLSNNFAVQVTLQRFLSIAGIATVAALPLLARYRIRASAESAS